ncbi:MAG: pilus assembly protein TadG-related protein [Rhodospirillales bacterium]|nr:pilus assembly protein TadG-related protein [Rhodospirillales bacterium]
MAILTAILIPILVGFAGIAIDVGVWYRERSRLQIAADAAAMAAARAYFAGDTTLSDLQPVALAEAQSATDSYLIGTLSPNSPVAIAAYPSGASQPTGITVTLTSAGQPYFSRLFGINAVKITATATAGALVSDACVLALTSANTQGISITGSAVVNSPDCSLFSDAAGTSSGYVCGSANVDALGFGTVGGVSVGCSASMTADEQTNQPPIANPLSNLTPPAAGPCASQNSFGPGYIDLTPGTYCGGLTISANSQVTFQPGTYIITNGTFTINGNTTIVSADGVTFYLGGSTPGGINWSGNTSSNVLMSAPTSGPYAGVLVYQDPAATAGNTITGNTDLAMSGTLYFPSTSFQMIGNSTAGPTTVQTQSGVGINIVAQTVSVTGNATLDTGDPQPIGASGAGAQISMLQ